MKAVGETVSTSAEHFAKRRRCDDTVQKDRQRVERMIERVFSPAHFPEQIGDWVLRETEDAKTWKVMAK
jgi:hypothetical protein